MKTFKTLTSQKAKINGYRYHIDHSYNAPYERNDLYLRLKAEKTPLSSQNLLEPDLGRTLYADIDYEYNYYVEEYERGTQEIKPNLLPSLNDFLLHKADIFPDRSLYVEAITLGGKIGQAQDPQYQYSMDYFRHYGTNINLLEDGIRDSILEFHSQPEIINKEMYRLYMDNENKREIFPFFGKIALEGIPDSQLANILETYNLDTKFVDFLIMHEKDDIINVEYEVQANSAFFSELESTYSTTVPEESKITRDIKAYDLKGFYTHIDDGHDTSYRISEPKDQSTCNFFESFLMSQIGRTKIQEYINNSVIGKTSPIVYKIRKYEFDNSVPESVHYFFNYEEATRFLFFDTQVTYGETTEYNITVINSIVTERQGSSSKYLIFMEEPYYSESFLLLDSPPISPDVELVTYRGVSNKVLILFNQMIDKRVEHPVYINESDQDTFLRQHEAQKIIVGAPIMFESDDPTHFEIFKTLSLPSSYSEFANEHYRVVDSGGLTAASYKDTITPNQTYYYMFRALDIHGFCSNPSPIYEFTLIKEGETLYPRIRIVELKPPSPSTQKSKSFKKYLKIGLTPGQYQIPREITNNVGDHLINSDIQIGTADDLVVGSGRTFKFRLKSKNTGKLIDINVTFKKNKVIRA